MDYRLSLLEEWLKTVIEQPVLEISSASKDASYRRYFRARTASTTFVVMDAPPDKEPLDRFIAVDKALIKQGVHAPKIYAKNISHGFLLLEDLGNQTYLPQLQNRADELYSDAIDALVKIQLGSHQQCSFEVPHYDQCLLSSEMELFNDWYLQTHLGLELDSAMSEVWLNTRDFLLDACLQQPTTWVHRDYHSRNLMIVSECSPAVIDFQDMVRGPISYDLASLFKDCYIEWPRARQHQWLTEYMQRATQAGLHLNFDLTQLIRWVDLTGLQRHLKVLGIFCRLNYRDGKAHYINDLPLVKKYVSEVIQIYSELSEFSSLFSKLHANAS
jgi:aminoglycoside/choline kinase family phosphotransferase